MELTKEYILGAINARNDAAVNALLGLYARQTADEQQSGLTRHENGMGFSGVDADILSSFAEQVQKKRGYGVKPGHELSEKQLVLLRKKLPKYGKQLLAIAQDKQARKAAGATSPEGEVSAPAPAPTEPSPLDSLPKGYIETETGWRVKTAQDFHDEGHRINLVTAALPHPAPITEPVSDFERSFLSA